MARASKQSRSEIIDTINAALEIVDDVAEEGDGELVRAVIAAFALKQISEGDYEDDRDDEDEDQPPEDEEEQGGEEEDEEELEEEPDEEPAPPKRTRARSASKSGSRSSRAKK